MTPLQIDGAYGEGGGQLVRTAVALAALTGTRIRVENIRARRDKPGLAAQHLTAVRAVATLCDAGVSGLELRSQQIVWNLLTNAIKFSPAQSTITVRSWTRNGRVWVSVRDEGPGIADEHQTLIFEKFVQVDGSSTRRHGGVGLGLDLVKHLVELHGGELKLDSAVGRGSTFTFGIPIEKRRKPRFEPQRKPLSHTTEPT